MPPIFGLDPRFVFLALLIVTIILGILLFGSRGIQPDQLRTIFLGLLFVPSLLLTAVVFFALLFRVDLSPYIRQAAVLLSGGEVASFEDAIPGRNPDLTQSLQVSRIFRFDTDGDDFNEWVVFYDFNLQSGPNPMIGAVYDGDRGQPPVIFPYMLRAPDRDYLGQSSFALDFNLQQITIEPNGPDGTDLPELVASDPNRLALYRFQQNSQPLDNPRDLPPRYEPIGFFVGTGGVQLNGDTKEVTVVDRGAFDRSQLAVRSIYALQNQPDDRYPSGQSQSYWSTVVPLEESRQSELVLASPRLSTIDFFETTPQDIFNTPYPEQIVLGFYASVCAVQDESLCRNFDPERNPRDFLAGEALSNFDSNQAAYFGLPSFNVVNLTVANLAYFPALESASADVQYTGPQPQLNVVEVTFTVDRLQQVRQYEVNLVEGQWKIVRALESVPANAGAAIEIPVQ